jgi:hypothetical protein
MHLIASIPASGLISIVSVSDSKNEALSTVTAKFSSLMCLWPGDQHFDGQEISISKEILDVFEARESAWESAFRISIFLMCLRPENQHTVYKTSPRKQ